mmetsp:Transcript_53769/g.144954  ORF Transcript_53769/g.144954 Transcript_53769/m.144954 type:complete len:201 (+) Transcript_53769:235-837(+)
MALGISPCLRGTCPSRMAWQSTSSCWRPLAAAVAPLRSSLRPRTWVSLRLSNAMGSTRSIVSLMRGCFTCSSSRCSCPIDGEEFTSMSHMLSLLSRRRSYPNSSNELAWKGMWSWPMHRDFSMQSTILPHIISQLTPRLSRRRRKDAKLILVPPRSASRCLACTSARVASPCIIDSSLWRWMEELVRWTILFSRDSLSVE